MKRRSFFQAVTGVAAITILNAKGKETKFVEDKRSKPKWPESSRHIRYETIRGCLYHTLNFYLNKSLDNVHHFFQQDIVGSSSDITNMTLPGRLPSPNQFAIESMSMGLLGSDEDIADFAKNRTVRLIIGQKYYWESPIALFLDSTPKGRVGKDGYKPIPLTLLQGQNFCVEVFHHKDHRILLRRTLSVSIILEGIHARSIC